MKQQDKLVLEKYFGARQELFDRDGNDVQVLISFIHKTLNGYGLEVIENEDCVLLSSLILHYRELCGIQGQPCDYSVMQAIRNKLIQFIDVCSADEDIDNDDYVNIACYAVAISYHLYYEGKAGVVFNKLVENGRFADYFNGASKMINTLEQYAKFNYSSCVSMELLYESLRQEIFQVWTLYQSYKHLSTSIFLFFLNSKMDFKEIEEMNEQYITKLNIKPEATDDDDDEPDDSLFPSDE